MIPPRQVLAPVQLLQPSYASSAFFRALRKVDGWQALPIYQAAQRVQRSADGAAYAAWDIESRALAQGLTGEAPGTFSCTFPPVRPSTAATRREVISDVSTALGPGAFAPEATLSYRWLVASWLVTRAPKYSLDRVSLSGWTWSPAKGWLADSRSRQRAVSFSLRPGA